MRTPLLPFLFPFPNSLGPEALTGPGMEASHRRGEAARCAVNARGQSGWEGCPLPQEEVELGTGVI